MDCDSDNSCTGLNIMDLPDHFLISVFSHQNLKQRINCSRVCKKWNRLCKDASIWTIMDLRENKKDLSIYDLKQIITHFGSASTKELLICGNFAFDYVPELNIEFLQISEKISTAERMKRIDMLDLEFITYNLKNYCPNLTLISFEYLDLSKINFNDFLQFNNLETFSLRWCKISPNWFDRIKENEISFNGKSINSNRICKIKNLYLIRTGLLTKADIENICEYMPELITLTINQAVSSLGDDSIEIICKKLINLKQLDLINTVISDNAVFEICNSSHLCSNLTRLNLTMSSKLSNNCLNLIAENLHGLNTLYLTSCFGISNISFLKNLKNLNYLNINNTSIDKSRIKEYLLPNLPKCEVEYGHAKMLNSKLMWTINSSRNSVCSF